MQGIVGSDFFLKICQEMLCAQSQWRRKVVGQKIYFLRIMGKIIEITYTTEHLYN